jgi:preprotein translocase subunit SecF
LEDLGLALFVGMIAGAYSSIFIATPLLAQMREAQPEMKEHRAKLAHRQTRAQHKESDRARTVTVALAEDAPVASDPGLVPADKLDPGLRQQPARKPRSQRKK